MYAFTSIANGISRRLLSDVTIENPHIMLTDRPSSDTCKAIWDTGATSSCVSANLAIRLGLPAIGKVNVNGVGGATVRNRHIINFTFQNGVTFHGVNVTDADLSGFDVLIGMDIIAQGDLSISNYKGQTVFTYRIPSQAKADYVQQAHVKDLVGPKHGNGKHKKKK